MKDALIREALEETGFCVIRDSIQEFHSDNAGAGGTCIGITDTGELF